MSTIPEVVAAHSLGLEVFAISLVTNLAAGMTNEVLTHTAVKTPKIGLYNAHTKRGKCRSLMLPKKVDLVSSVS
jgi:purine nucleoside phosphorylase